MGCFARVLTNIECWQADGLKSEREQIIETMISGLIEHVSSYWPTHIIDHFTSWRPDTSLDSGNLILGCERPDELLEEVKEWNLNIAHDAIVELEYLEEWAREECGSHRISDLIIEHMTDDGIFREFSLYGVRKTLTALDNYFVHGSDRMVFVKSPKTGIIENSCMISQRILEDVKHHPEKYFIVELCYD